jgi:hypothetical protein
MKRLTPCLPCIIAAVLLLTVGGHSADPLPRPPTLQGQYVAALFQHSQLGFCLYESQFLEKGTPGFPPDMYPLTYVHDKIAALEKELWDICINQPRKRLIYRPGEKVVDEGS